MLHFHGGYQVARMAGIEVFVTGGVGGVHRGGQVSLLNHSPN